MTFKAIQLTVKSIGERTFDEPDDAIKEAVMMSCEVGVAFVYSGENTFPSEIYVDGWAFYPAPQAAAALSRESEE